MSYIHGTEADYELHRYMEQRLTKNYIHGTEADQELLPGTETDYAGDSIQECVRELDAEFFL